MRNENLYEEVRTIYIMFEPAAWAFYKMHNDLMLRKVFFFHLHFKPFFFTVLLKENLSTKQIENIKMKLIVWLKTKLDSSRLKKTLNANLKSLIVFFIFIKINLITKKKKLLVQCFCEGKIS